MPATDGWPCRGDDSEAVVILLTVDGVYETQERVGRTRIGLGGHRDSIFDTPIVQRQVHPHVGTVQYEAVGIGGQQIGIAALIGVAVDVDGRTGQVGVWRTLNVATVGQRELYLADRSGNDCRREPVTIVAADLILLYTEVEVIVRQVLVAQTYLGEDLAELTAILCEDGR